jgi:hypothetical protein
MVRGHDFPTPVRCPQALEKKRREGKGREITIRIGIKCMPFGSYGKPLLRKRIPIVGCRR